MKLTKTAANMLDVVIARLDVEDPAFAACSEIRAALGGPCRLYLNTHVLPLLRALREQNVPGWMRESAEQDATWVLAKRHRSHRSNSTADTSQ